MITNAKIASIASLCKLDWGRPESRRLPEYQVTPTDLVIFGNSPARWVNRPGEDPESGPTRSEYLRAVVLAENAAGARYVVPPEEYTAIVRVCPDCHSESGAKSCRKCGKDRVATATKRPWSQTAKTCKEWAQDKVAKGLVPVPRAVVDLITAMADAVAANQHALEAVSNSSHLFHITGTWQSEDGSMTVPLQCLIDLVTMDDSELSGSLGTVLVVPDVSPGGWAQHLVRGGHHIQAAVARQLYQAATGEDIMRHLWLLIENREPHLIGRRRSTPELEVLAWQTAERLLERMWFCRKWNLWPTFDADCAAALPAWTETYLEDWMTQAGAGASGYWALDGVDKAKESREELPAAA